MTTPPAPPAPPVPGPPAPPPAPPEPEPAPPAPEPEDKPAELRAALDRERNARKAAEAELATLRKQGMTDHDRAIAEAREQGKAEAEEAAALDLAAAAFRLAAVGKLADAEGALAVLDLRKLLGADGKPDAAAIEAAVGRLAAAPTAPPGGYIPAGPRTPEANGDDDWIRRVRRS